MGLRLGSSRLRRAFADASHVVVVAAVLVTGLSATPVAHASGPAITVTPNTGLVSGQTVTVAGSGFFAGEDLIAAQCPRTATDPVACDFGNFVEVVANGRGRFSTTLAVHRTVMTDGGFLDCAPSACKLVLADSSNFADQASAPLKFDASVPLPETTVKVTPSTGLGDRQTVTITGTGFTADRTVFVNQCVADSFSCEGGFLARANKKGRFSLVGSVHRSVIDNEGNPVDCAGAAGTCLMLAIDPVDADYHSSAPLEFDPNLPPPPPPTLTVVPSDDLPYYARVAVHGKHWAAGDQVLLMECPPASDPLFCFNIIGIAQVAADGTISAEPLLSRKVVDLFSGKTVDCAKRNRCVVMAEGFSGDTPPTVPITFDPAAPIPPRPRVTLNPAGPYADSQVVTVTGRNFAPNASFSNSECFSSDNFGGCLIQFQRKPPGLTDANGNFSTTVKLHRFIKVPGEKIDCADPSVSCTLSSASEGGADVETPLVFANSAAVRPIVDMASATVSVRRGWAASAAPTCHGLAMSPRVARVLAANPRWAAEACSA